MYKRQYEQLNDQLKYHPIMLRIVFEQNENVIAYIKNRKLFPSFTEEELIERFDCEFEHDEIVLTVNLNSTDLQRLLDDKHVEYLLEHQLLYLKDSGYSEEVFRNFLSKENVERFLSGGVHGMLYAFLFEEIKEVIISSIRKNFLNYEKNIYNIATSHIGDYKGNSKFGNPNDEKFLENVTKIIIEQKHQKRLKHYFSIFS